VRGLAPVALGPYAWRPTTRRRRRADDDARTDDARTDDLPTDYVATDYVATENGRQTVFVREHRASE
jgi:hypothetical protein